MQNSRIKDLKVGPHTIKLRGKYRQMKMYVKQIHLNIFFNTSPRIMEIKTKVNKQDLFKHKFFHINHNKIKIQPIKWEKIFANNVVKKALVSKIYTVHATQYKKSWI